MLSEKEWQGRQRRRAWWLKVAREVRGMNLVGVAAALGLAKSSASQVSFWERALAEPSLKQLSQLATLYDCPLSLFTDSPETDEERFLRASGQDPDALLTPEAPEEPEADLGRTA